MLFVFSYLWKVLVYPRVWGIGKIHVFFLFPYFTGIWFWFVIFSVLAHRTKISGSCGQQLESTKNQNSPKKRMKSWGKDSKRVTSKKSKAYS
jgi:hypothetical protein